MDEIEAYWSTLEENRLAFVKGKLTGRAISAGVVLSALAATAAVATLPVWGLWSLGAVCASVAFSNFLGYAKDKDTCQMELGRVVLDKPALGQSKDGLYKEGLTRGLKTPLKMLPVHVLVTPFWPVVFVFGALVNKGTRGYAFFPPRSQSQSESGREMACELDKASRPSGWFNISSRSGNLNLAPDSVTKAPETKKAPPKLAP